MKNQKSNNLNEKYRWYLDVFPRNPEDCRPRFVKDYNEVVMPYVKQMNEKIKEIPINDSITALNIQNIVKMHVRLNATGVYVINLQTIKRKEPLNSKIDEISQEDELEL